MFQKKGFRHDTFSVFSYYLKYSALLLRVPFRDFLAISRPTKIMKKFYLLVYLFKFCVPRSAHILYQVRMKSR